MIHQTRREYLLSIHGRYGRADRKQKQVILNEFCANTGYNRKYAIRLLNGPPPRRVERSQRRPRPPNYGPGVASVLAGVWEAAAYPWSVRLKALLPTWMLWIKLRFRLNPETERQLQHTSARQMDRRLQAHKQLTGVGWRQIVENMHKNATVAQWYKTHGKHEIYARGKDVNLNSYAHSLNGIGRRPDAAAEGMGRGRPGTGTVRGTGFKKDPYKTGSNHSSTGRKSRGQRSGCFHLKR